MKKIYAILKPLSAIVLVLIVEGFFSGINAQGYIYVHKKSMGESIDANFTFNITGAVSTTFQLNDFATNVQIEDLGAAQDGRLWAVDKTNKLYYRNNGSSNWIFTGVTDASRVDGGPGGICYYTTIAGNVFTNDGTTATQIYAGTDATDVASTWSGQPFMIAGSTIFRYNGAGTNISDWPRYNTSAAVTGYSQIDGNIATGNVYGRGTDGNVYMIPAGGTAATSLGKPAGTILTGKEDVGIAADGSIYGIWQFNGGGNWYVYKYSGGTWTAELQARYADVVTGGVGGQVWADNAFFAGVPPPYSNIITRAVSGSTVSWLDDERVRVSPTAGNSYMIAVPAGTYTVTETLTGGWDLKAIGIYDPTNNSTTNVLGNSSTLKVANGEIVNVVYENTFVNTTIVSTSCTNTNYIQTFGSGTATYEPPIAGLTSMHYIAGTKFADGYYSLEKTSSSWPDNPSLKDHTPTGINADPNNGYFMTINASYAPDEFYRQRVTGLLTSIPYTLSFYAANLSPNNVTLRPDITFGTMDVNTGTVIGSVTTGDIAATTWTKYSYSFIPTSSTIDLFIRNNQIGGDGNDLALDDITFSVAPPITPVTSVINTGCGTLGSITFTAPTGSIYEYSIDNFATVQSYPNTVFSNLAPGTYTVSARYAVTTGCVVSKVEVIKAAICGNVYNDVNGLTDNTVNGPGINVGGTLIAVLYDITTGKVVDTAYVTASGTYTVHGAIGDNYSVYLTTVPVTIGQTALPVVTPPAGWVNTGNQLGSGTASNATPGILHLGVVNVSTTDVNFGIEQPPVAQNNSGTGIVGNPVTIPNILTNDNDPSGTSLNTDSVSLILPAGATSPIYDAQGDLTGFVVPGQGTWSYNSATGETTFTPATGYTGNPTPITYTVADIAGVNSNIATITITYALAAPLPVTLESFTGMAKDCNTVLLNWKVSDAVNFNRFEIERSTNGIDFKTMGSVVYNTSIANYNFSETIFEKGSYQYRLKMIDTDGKNKYSPVVFIRLDCNKQRTLLVYPNPAKDKITINGLKGGEKVTMYDAQGQLVYTKQSTDYQLNIDMKIFRSGMYYVVVIDKSGEKISESKIGKID